MSRNELLPLIKTTPSLDQRNTASPERRIEGKVGKGILAFSGIYLLCSLYGGEILAVLNNDKPKNTNFKPNDYVCIESEYSLKGGEICGNWKNFKKTEGMLIRDNELISVDGDTSYYSVGCNNYSRGPGGSIYGNNGEVEIFDGNGCRLRDGCDTLDKNRDILLNSLAYRLIIIEKPHYRGERGKDHYQDARRRLSPCVESYRVGEISLKELYKKFREGLHSSYYSCEGDYYKSQRKKGRVYEYYQTKEE